MHNRAGIQPQCIFADFIGRVYFLPVVLPALFLGILQNNLTHSAQAPEITLINIRHSQSNLPATIQLVLQFFQLLPFSVPGQPGLLRPGARVMHLKAVACLEEQL